MKRLAKALVVARIKETERHKATSWDKPKRGPWDRKKVKKADGGDVDKPAFDPSQPFQAADDKPPFDPSQPFEAAPDQQLPDRGTLHALGHGALQGATFNFGDELAGLRAAGSDNLPDIFETPVGPIPARELQGAYRLAKNWLVGGDPESVAAYTKARDAERQAVKEAQANHPYVYGAGEVAGSLPAMAALPETGLIKGAGVAANLGRGALAGAEYGALSGAGEGTDATSRLEGASSGAIGGGLGGTLGAAGSETLGAAGKQVLGPAIQTYRGLRDPEGEAARRVAGALLSDEKMIQEGTAKGMTLPQWVAARNAGEPVTLADLGAGNTQSLLRSAANTSPEGRAMLEKVIEDRFLNQSDRVANTVRGLVPGGANAGQTADDLVAAYDKGRKPLYKQAYNEGDREIMTPEMERLMGSPTFEQAMKNAVTSGKDRAISEGYGAFNPGVTVENGLIKFSKTKPNGVPQYPNLQYWDAVKKELDGMASVARRQGDTTSVAGNLANKLRDELDQQVPSYANARGFASQFFGENNALEAGRTLAGKKVDPAVITQAMSKMKPDEQNLFREGYASDWANRVISNIKDTQDITKAMFNSPNERARALAVFGPARLAKIEARITLETIMDGARRAMGNSTTARQLIEAGLAGGALGGYDFYQSGSPLEGLKGLGEGAAAGFGVGKLVRPALAAGAKKVAGYVDGTTARNVARLLTSNDPNDLAAGFRMATKNQKIANGLRRIANTVGVSSGAPQGSQAATGFVPRLQGPVPASASDEQRQPPRAGNQ